MNFQTVLKAINDNFVGCSGWPELRAFSDELIPTLIHGDSAKWMDALNALKVGAGSETQMQLMALHPWRKGPLNIFDTHIDTEWRSDWKWQRLVGQGLDFKGKSVLDVGCGNGFYMYEMLKAGANSVVGVDPTLLFAAQFITLMADQPTNQLAFIPAGLEVCPETPSAFDLVLSMGVLYHRNDQHQHLKDLFNRTKSSGQIVIETMVLEGDAAIELIPHTVGNKRYAQMRNVWSIPTLNLLQARMTDCGYENIQLVDCSYTSLEEQRTTGWMRFQSLADFLDADDRRKTVEGHQAPKRAILIADRS